MKGYYSRYQLLIYNEALLGARVKNCKMELEGRLLTCDIQVGDVNDNKFLKPIGCYAVPQGNRVHADGTTRTNQRKDLYHKMIKTLSPNNLPQRTTLGFKSSKRQFIGKILMGDLQETITTTARDNRGETKYKWIQHNG